MERHPDVLVRCKVKALHYNDAELEVETVDFHSGRSPKMQTQTTFRVPESMVETMDSKEHMEERIVDLIDELSLIRTLVGADSDESTEEAVERVARRYEGLR